MNCPLSILSTYQSRALQETQAPWRGQRLGDYNSGMRSVQRRAFGVSS
jgi:hypothetical protein